VVHLVVVDGQVVVKDQHLEIHIPEHLLMSLPILDGVIKVEIVLELLVIIMVEAAAVLVLMDKTEPQVVLQEMVVLV
jgi:hypothetical protein